MDEYQDIQDDPRPALAKKQLDKPGIDFIEEDEDSYYAMADDIKTNQQKSP